MCDINTCTNVLLRGKYKVVNGSSATVASLYPDIAHPYMSRSDSQGTLLLMNESTNFARSLYFTCEEDAVIYSIMAARNLVRSLTCSGLI